MRNATVFVIARLILLALLSASCGGGNEQSSVATAAPGGAPGDAAAAQTSSGLTKTPQSVFNLLQSVYLFQEAIPEDPDDFDTVESLIEALDDPFTLVLPNLQATLDAFSGKFRGIGVRIQQVDDLTFFLTVFPGTPADRAGLRQNDILLGVDSLWVEGKTLAEITAMIRRDVGEVVHLRVLRGDEILTISPTIEEFQQSSVFSVAMTEQIAYMRVFTFLNESSHPDGTDGEIRQFLLSDSSPVMIMDLRGNLGGTLADSIETTDLFVEIGILIQLFNLSKTDIRMASAGDPGEDRTVIILQDGQSASASEIVIASLRENVGAHTIGTRSFGKGVTQNFFAFTDDPGGLQLVTGGIRSPNGFEYHGIGFAPDEEVPFVFNQETFSDSQLDAAIAFARTLPGIDPDQPILPSAMEQIRALRGAMDPDASPVLIDRIESEMPARTQ